MNKNLNRDKIFLKYFIMIFLILFASKPLPIFDINFSIVIHLVVLGLTIIGIIVYRYNIIRKNIVTTTLVLLAINSIAIFKYNEFHPRFFLIYWIALAYTYFTLNLLKRDFFIVLENLVYYWCLIIIMPLYILSIVAPDFLATVITSIPYTVVGNEVYTNHIYSYIFGFTPGDIRNCGFAWEPGIFACIISIVIYANIIQNSFKFNQRLLFFIIVVITTFSTTGYILVCIIFLWYILNKYGHKASKISVIPLTLVLIVIIAIKTPVIFEKINASMEEAQDLDRIIIGASENQNSFVHPQRIASFIITWKDFLRNPIFGTVGNFTDRWYFKEFGMMENFSVISGIGNFMTLFGLLGLFIYFFFFIKSSKLLGFDYLYKYGYIIVIIVTVTSISYNIFNSSFFLCFIFYSALLNRNNEDYLIMYPNKK